MAFSTETPLYVSEFHVLHASGDSQRPVELQTPVPTLGAVNALMQQLLNSPTAFTKLLKKNLFW